MLLAVQRDIRLHLGVAVPVESPLGLHPYIFDRAVLLVVAHCFLRAPGEILNPVQTRSTSALVTVYWAGGRDKKVLKFYVIVT